MESNKKLFLDSFQEKGRVKRGVRDGFEAASCRPPILLCSGRITGVLPRLRLAALQSFTCVGYVDSARLPVYHGKAVLQQVVEGLGTSLGCEV